MAKTKRRAAALNVFDEDIVKRMQARLKAATYGSTAVEFFGSYDKDGSGALDTKEFRRMVRVDLKVGSERQTIGVRTFDLDRPHDRSLSQTKAPIAHFSP